MDKHQRPVGRKACTAVSLGSLAALAILTGPGAQAAPPTSPSLNPPPPGGYTCQTTGGGTICHRKMDFSHLASYDATCPQGFDILENGANAEIGHRYYDRNGDLVRRDLHETFPAGDPLNVFYNSVTGTSVPYSADFTESDTFAVPGDFDTMTSTFTGNLYSATLPRFGLLVHDAGTLVFDPNGDVATDHGPKMLFDGDVTKLCAALDQP